MLKKSLITMLLTALSVAAAWGQETSRILYTLNGKAQTVSKMSLETFVIQNDIVTVGVFPNRIHARGDKVYVVNSTPPGITVIDVASDLVVSNIALPEGSNPWDMEFIEDEKVFVTSLIANAVFVYDLATGDSLDMIAVGNAPQGLLVVGEKAYVANTGGFATGFMPSTVSIIDIPTLSVTHTLSVPLNPQEIDIAPDGTIHVVCTGNFGDVSGRLVIIDPNPPGTEFNPTITDTLEFGGSPGDLAITSDGLGYLVDFGDGANGFLYSYNTATKEVLHSSANPILVGNVSLGLFYDKVMDELYVANFGDDTVQLIDPADGSVLNTFDFGDGPADMVVVEIDPTTSVQRIDDRLPSDFHLSQNYPNPFNPETRIEFSVPKRASVRLAIYNLGGQLIRTLVDRPFQTGSFSVTWDGRDDSDRAVASGVYLYELKTADTRIAKRLTLLK